MDWSEPFEQRLGAWIRAQRPDQSPLYQHVAAPGCVRIVEREAAGEADVTCRWSRHVPSVRLDGGRYAIARRCSIASRVSRETEGALTSRRRARWSGSR